MIATNTTTPYHGGSAVNIIISNSSGKPIYEQITSQIKNMIDVYKRQVNGFPQLPEVVHHRPFVRLQIIRHDDQDPFCPALLRVLADVYKRQGMYQ